MFSDDYPIKLEDCSLYAVKANCAALPFDAQARLYKLFVVDSGTFRLNLNGKEYTVGSGESALFFPYEEFELVSDGGSFSYSYVCFALNSVRYGDALEEANTEQRAECSRIFSDSNICITVKNICSELESESEAFSDELVSLLSSQMLVYLSRHFGVHSDGTKNANDANYKVCSQVMSFIDSRIYTMKNLREVASEMGYNYSYISTLFRKTTGTTLNTYFKTKRMNEAKRLLQDNKMSVSEIAKVMNYSSVYAFSKAFKEYYGSSPGHYSGRFPKKDE